MSCCLCKLIKRYLYRCFDCCYKIETVDHKNYIGVYCSYTYCPSNYNLKDKSGINIKYRGHFYCNEQCLKMHKSTDFYTSSATDVNPFEYSEYTIL